jgi:hypothetical protein
VTARTTLAAPRRWPSRVAGGVAGAVLVLNLWPIISAGAESPVVQTWWTVNNLTFDLPFVDDVLPPGAIPAVTIPVSDVPDGGSEVAGTVESPTGALTLRYEFPAGSTFDVLQLTATADVRPTPAMELIACPLVGDGQFESHPTGGPISQLPESDCSRGVPGILDEATGTFRFEGISAIAEAEHLSVAVLPLAGRAVLERALSGSLDVERPDEDGGITPLRPSPQAQPPVPDQRATAPTFLGQVQEPAPPPAAAPPPPGEMPPARDVQPVAERFVTVFRSTGAGQGAGSAVAGLVLVLLAASSVWRRGRAAILDVSAPG